MGEVKAIKRIAYLTSGAANMFCGSCLHDNTLARAWNRQGIDALLVPTYTPIRTDEEDVSVDQVFLGGINVYLQQKIFFFRYLPAFLDRFLDSKWLLQKATSRGLEISARALGSLTVSMLKGRNGNQRKEVKRLCSWLSKEINPDVVLLSNLLIGGCISDLKRLGIPVVVTLQGDDIFLEDLIEPFKQQALSILRRIVPDVSGFLVHSQYYKEYMMSLLEIPAEKVHVVPLGIEVEDVKIAQTDPTRPRTIGYMARMSKEKGLHVLVDAFIELKKMPDTADVRLHLAGWRGVTNQTFADEQIGRLKEAGLEHSFIDYGTVDRDGKQVLLSESDLLCVPTTYKEPKGLFALEALAHGVPVVLPEHGAFPEVIRDLGGGRLVPPDDPQALAACWHDLLKDRSALSDLGLQGRKAVLSRRDAETMATKTLEVLNQIVQQDIAST
ncbi:MAG: glycosyltransferase family 4 protein [Planctomycetota bacterium]|nr:glycosyltransferase family 4 protein [Planctomycetota bacterium]